MHIQGNSLLVKKITTTPSPSLHKHPTSSPRPPLRQPRKHMRRALSKPPPRQYIPAILAAFFQHLLLSRSERRHASKELRQRPEARRMSQDSKDGIEPPRGVLFTALWLALQGAERKRRDLGRCICARARVRASRSWLWIGHTRVRGHGIRLRISGL